MDKMNELTSPEKPYIAEEELNKRHEEYEMESISQYTETPSIGKEHVVKKYCINIKKSISSRFPQFIKINKAKLVKFCNDVLLQLTNKLLLLIPSILPNSII